VDLLVPPVRKPKLLYLKHLLRASIELSELFCEKRWFAKTGSGQNMRYRLREQHSRFAPSDVLMQICPRMLQLQKQPGDQQRDELVVFELLSPKKVCKHTV
jgi:hypothetical protein